MGTGRRSSRRQLLALSLRASKRRSASLLIRRTENLFCAVTPIAIWMLTLAWILGIFEVLPVFDDDPHWYAAPNYLAPAILHGVYGLCLFGVGVGVGVGALLLFKRRQRLTNCDVGMLAIPVGFVLLAIFSVASELLGWFGLLASLLLTVTLCRLAFRDFEWPKPSASRGFLIASVALSFGCHLAFVWRPATIEYAGGIDLGDIMVYVHYYFSLKKDLIQFVDLASEGGLRPTYFNTIFTFVALLVDGVPGFDIFLFQTATLGTLYPLFLFWATLQLLAFRAERHPPLSKGMLVLLGLLLIPACFFPSWILSSPPAVLMAPVALATGYLVVRSGRSTALLASTAIFTLFASAATKVVSIIVLGAYAGVGCLHSMSHRRNAGQIAMVLVAGGVVALYGLYMLNQFGTFLNAPELQVPGDTWTEVARSILLPRTGYRRALLSRAGLIVVLAGIALDRNWPLAIGGAVGLAGNFLVPFLFTSTTAALFLLIFAHLALASKPSRAAVLAFGSGALMTLPRMVRFEPGGASVVALWSLTMFAVVVLAANHPRHARNARNARKISRTITTIGIVAFCAVSLVAVATGKFRIGNERPQEMLTPALYEVWVKTRELTSEEGLVFTDQTGPLASRLSGWNDYATLAKRQFFLTSWQATPMRRNEALRFQRLQTNDRVLTGTLHPEEVALSRCYDAYYGVVAADRPVPANFNLMFENAGYRLYEIPPRPNARCQP